MNPYSTELAHHGILGQKWGVRRYQNPDGSLTTAGKKKYGYDRDVNDTSRHNVAKIRLGEAKRRLDYAKSHPKAGKYENNTRIAELQGRVRSAKKEVKNTKAFDRGAKLAAKGQTITGNKVRSYMALAGSVMASRGITAFLNSRMSTLSAQGRWTPNHTQVAQLLNNVGSYAVQGAALAYTVKKGVDNQNLRAYNRSQWDGSKTIKRVGSQEYADRKAKATKKEG